MKQYKLIFFLLTFYLAVSTSYAQTKFMSFNIRYNSANDGEDLWDLRKDDLVKMLNYYQPDFVGMQEVTPRQLDFIAQHLETYNFIGYGRDGIGTDSEAIPIFYNKAKFELISNETFWLSETPSKISKGWDAALNRIALYGVFKNTSTNQIVHIINTHFDHRGEQARRESASLLINFVNKKQLENENVVLMGDLNCQPNEEPYRLLLEEFDDSFKLLNGSPVYGPVTTWNGFDLINTDTRRIDYILTKNIEVSNYRCVDDRRMNNRHLSDHFAVLINCKLD